jgi:UDPglucose--hexose-1-phosphate uridylyltransferase
MSELRRDPIIGRWVIIASERSRRPREFAVTEDVSETECPFCEGREKHTPPEIYAARKPDFPANGPGWKVRAVDSISPLLQGKGGLGRKAEGLYDLMNGIGKHEVIIETPKHIDNICDLDIRQLSEVINCYVNRFVELEKDPRIKYVLLYKNYGRRAGGSKIKHAHSQIIATPINPKRVKEELAGAKKYFDYKERCIFCDILRQEAQQKQRLVLDVDGFVAIAPFASRFPFELWILPKEHNCDFSSLDPGRREKFAYVLKITLLKLKKLLGNPPYNFLIHTAPFRRAKAGYWDTITEDYHWHLEIIPSLARLAGFEWGSGFYLNPSTPEDNVRALRKARV